MVWASSELCVEITLTDLILPDGFLRFSDAVSRLAQGMWGGLRRPIPVRRIKGHKQYKNVSVVFAPWKQQAGRRVSTAATEGDLPVYIFACSNAQSDTPYAQPAIREPVVLPTQLLGRLITTHGCFPDHPIRPSMKTAGGDKEIHGLLKTGIIVVRSKEFEIWYRAERDKGRWASQHSRLKKTGRPSTQTKGLRGAIIVALREGKTSIAALRRRLETAGRTDVPSPDTLARLVDQLHRETGERELFRKPSRRR
jgi:hypothetical protein